MSEETGVTSEATTGASVGSPPIAVGPDGPVVCQALSLP